MSLRIHSRRCPGCAARLSAEAGRAWLTCPECPLAVELGSGTRVATYRPDGEEAALGPRLPFWLFRTGQGSPLWVAGFRCFNQPQRPDVDRLLTERRHDPPLAIAPLGSRLARGPEEARVLAETSCSRYSPNAQPQLVSLAVVVVDGHVTEPLTRWRVLTSLVRPW